VSGSIRCRVRVDFDVRGTEHDDGVFFFACVSVQSQRRGVSARISRRVRVAVTMRADADDVKTCTSAVEDALGVEGALDEGGEGVGTARVGVGDCSRSRRRRAEVEDEAAEAEDDEDGGGGGTHAVASSETSQSSESSATARERKFWKRVFDARATPLGVGRYADSEDSECDVVVGEDADEAELTRELIRVLAQSEVDAREPQDVSGDWSFDKVEFDKESLRDVVDIVATYVGRREPSRDVRDDIEASEVLMQQFNYLSLCADADYVDENREVITGELLPLLDDAAEAWFRLARGAEAVSRKAMDLKAKFVRLLDDMNETRGDAS